MPTLLSPLFHLYRMSRIVYPTNPKPKQTKQVIAEFCDKSRNPAGNCRLRELMCYMLGLRDYSGTAYADHLIIKISGHFEHYMEDNLNN